MRPGGEKTAQGERKGWRRLLEGIPFAGSEAGCIKELRNQEMGVVREDNAQVDPFTKRNRVEL